MQLREGLICLSKRDIRGITCAHHHPHYSSSVLQFLFVLSSFLKRFLSGPVVFGMCISYACCRPTLKSVLIPISLWLCTTELYKCINAAGMNTCIWCIVSHWPSEWEICFGGGVLNSCEAEGFILTDIVSLLRGLLYIWKLLLWFGAIEMII